MGKDVTGMAGNYQLKRTGYALPHNLYMQVKYIIRDYDTMRRERDLLARQAERDGERYALLCGRVAAIENAAEQVSAAYGAKRRRDDVESFSALDAFDEKSGLAYFRYTLYDPEKGREPSYMTWRRCRQMLAYLVARQLNFIQQKNTCL